MTQTPLVAVSMSTPAATLHGLSHRFCRVNGLRFHYVEAGREDGPVLVLLAGFPQSSFAWRGGMKQLADRYRILAIDLRGQRDSDKPLSGYDTQTVATRVHDLLSTLGHERYFLVGHDIGAWVAFPYAHLFAEEVVALTLMDAGIPGVTLPASLPSSSDVSWKTWHFSFLALPDLPEKLLEGRERLYLAWFMREKSADPTWCDEETITEYLRLFTAPGGMRAWLSFYRELARSAEQNGRLAEAGPLAMPVLALGADQGSIRDLGGALSPFCSKLTSRTVANCGHFQPDEQPEAVAAAIADFFR